MSLKKTVYSDALRPPIVLTAMLLGLMLVIGFTNQAAINRQNRDRAAGLSKIYGDFQDRTMAYAVMIANSRDVQEGAAGAKRAKVKAAIDPLFQSLDVGLIIVHEFDGYVIARGHDPVKFGEPQADLFFVKRALSGATTRGIRPIDGRLALFTTVPVQNVNPEGKQQFVGAVTVGYFFDESFATSMKTLVGSEIVIVENTSPLASTNNLLKRKGMRFTPDSKRVVRGGRWFDIRYVPLQSGNSNSRVGLVIAVDNTRAKAIMFITMGVSFLIICGVLFWVVRRARIFSETLTRPIINTADHAKRVAGGELGVEPLDVNRDDEIGALMDSFNVMVANIQDMVKRDKTRREYLEGEVARLLDIMNAAAAGDPNAHFEVRRQDEIGRIGAALNTMVADISERNEQDRGERDYLETQVRKLLTVMENAAGGDFSATFTVERQDEIGRVGAALNTMIRDLRDMIESDKQRRRALESKVRTLLAGINTVAAGDLSFCFPSHEDDEFSRIGAALNAMLADLMRKIEEIEHLKQTDQIQKELLESHIKDILGAVTRAASGDLTVRLVTQDHGAINDLRLNLNTMLGNLLAMIQRVHQAAIRVESTCKDINKTAQHLQEGAEQQQGTIRTTTSAVDGLASSISTMARHAEDVLALSTNATGEARSGGDTAHQAIQGIALVQDTMNDLHTVMGELETSAEEIEEVVKVIDEISDQTNLLALNASIEAARAGDLGRGFAVVAKEVSSLAQKSVTSTREITNIVRRIQDRVKKAQQTADLGISRVQQGSELVNRAGEALERIVESISGVTDLARDTAHALENQKADSSQIVHAVKNVRTISENSTAIIKQAAGAVESLFTLASELEGMVKQFKIQ
jgi:methyl-accepting chemotaxis protein